MISISGIYDRADLGNERVHFRADADIDLSFYVLFDTNYIGTQVAAGNHLAFWFGPQRIQRGEHVVVYTRAGNPNQERRPDGQIYNFLFRGLPNPQYGNPISSVTIMQLQNWAVVQPGTAPLPPLAPTPYNAATGFLGLGGGGVPPAPIGRLGDAFGGFNEKPLSSLADLLKPKKSK